LLFLLPLLVWCAPAHAIAVKFIQATENSGVNNATATTYVVRFPNATLSGNLIACFFNTGTGNTGGTVADNIGNTYTRRVNVTGSQRVAEFDSQGATLGTQVITYTPSTGVNNIQGECAEFAGIASTSALDGTCSRTGTSGTTVNCSSAITTTVNGDLILHYGVQDTGVGMTSWTNGGGSWKFCEGCTDIQIGQALQYQVQATAGAITPSMTQAPTHNFDTVAIAFKADSTKGTLPSGIHVYSATHANILAATASPIKIPVTCDSSNSVNLIIVKTLVVDAKAVTAISDTAGNTYSFTETSLSSGSGSGNLRIGYTSTTFTCSQTNVLSVTYTGSGGSGDTVIVLSVAGAATAPAFDTTGSRVTGTDSTTTAHSINGSAITPTTTGGIVVSMMGLTNPGPSDTASASGGGTAVSLAGTSNPEAGSGDMDENNGYSLQYNTASSARTMSFHFPATAGGAGSFASISASFKALATGGTPANQYPRIIGGTR
jgi:hypothetical protein